MNAPTSEFFDRTLADLGNGDIAVAGRARRLLERYVPDGPRDGSPASWSAWWRDNRAYAFASDAGDYRWYVDPLAKKRDVPTRELRGPRRADL